MRTVINKNVSYFISNREYQTMLLVKYNEKVYESQLESTDIMILGRLYSKGLINKDETGIDTIYTIPKTCKIR